ncbi:flagellar export chaperone FliS [Cohnella lubricantis]|uniref:Flagellar secretion chaperone FliS n=1 Tax=Cohnella lubricantis TaxID=2163172 RepID=A0A841T7V7_9BACL|nr:flagellar export chaperone FliS [Cohnella lubricantis]MBB6677404.1 flagellar export chaperone FliS [Cohnella lubricantis]MBP2118705.1 flagellar protein FliS [Cohnella lubricantis]
MNGQAQQAYLQMQVKTASPGELTLMLYNGCIRFMKQAQHCIETRDYAGKNQYIQKAQNIIEELLITLDPQYEISANLADLYRFMQSQLVEANIRLQVDSLQSCINLMTELKDTWAEAVKLARANAPVQEQA